MKLINFNWLENETNQIKYYNDKLYRIEKTKYGKSYRVDLFENDSTVLSDNTSNDSFKNQVSKEDNIDSQIITWASNKLNNSINNCDKCSELKIVEKLTKGAKLKEEFNGYETLCKNCRSQIFAIINEKYQKEIEAKHKEDLKELEKKPPEIIGGFKKRIEAYRLLKSIPNPEREEEDGMVFCKGIVQANDGTFYPVFLTIATPGGELWDSGFIAENYEEVISQDLIFPFIKKNQDEIFPYEYQALSHIEEDFHQKTRFGNIIQKSVRHQFINQIKFQRPETWEGLEDSVHVEVRSYFSIQHILSASIFLKEVGNYEKNFKGELSDDNIIFHKSFIVSIILSCVCFLESTINELFMDASENPEGIVKDLSKANIKMLSKMWARGIPRTANYNIIEKYQIALSLTKKLEMDLGEQILQDVSVLIKLRNSLIHFEPETVITKSINEPELVKMQKLEKQLKGKFEVNRFVGENNLFFPDKCLSIGCATWAIKSVLNFTDVFFDKIELIPSYQLVRYKLDIILKDSINNKK